jgi:hypothetical protein
MSAKGMQGLTLAGEPRVQLMPPSIAERERVRRARSLAVLATILAIVLVAGAATFAFLRSATAAAELEAARADTALIQAQQTEFAPGRTAATAVADTEEAISIVGTTDVLWAKVFADIKAALPAGTTIDQADVVARAPWEALLFPPAEAPLRGPREVTIMLVLSSDNIVHPMHASMSFEATVASLADVYVYESVGEEDKGRFLTKIELTLDSTVLSGRYASDKLEELLERDSVEVIVAARKLSREALLVLFGTHQATGPVAAGDPAAPEGEAEGESEGESDEGDAEGDTETTTEGDGQ